MAEQVVKQVDFEGRQIETVMDGYGKKWVSVSRISNNIGIDTHRQINKIKKDPKFRWQHMSGRGIDGKEYKNIFCIPLEQLNGWLFTINSKKIKLEIRDILIKYQQNCMQVLHDFWNTGIAIADTKDLQLINSLQGKINSLQSNYDSTLEVLAMRDEQVESLQESLKNQKSKTSSAHGRAKNVEKAKNQEIAILNQQYSQKITSIYAEGNAIIADLNARLVALDNRYQKSERLFQWQKEQLNYELSLKGKNIN